MILGVENIKFVINSKLSAFDRENRLVFFQTIPTSPNLPTLPVGISVMEPISFDPPKYDNLIEFTYNPKKTKGSGVKMKSLVEMIVRSLVDYPDEVSINETSGESIMILEINVSPDDVGKVIGKEGRIANAIRTIVKAAAAKSDKKSNC